MINILKECLDSSEQPLNKISGLNIWYHNLKLSLTILVFKLIITRYNKGIIVEALVGFLG